jgi:cobalt-precorrin-5B (C1)-methyltransferase
MAEKKKLRSGYTTGACAAAAALGAARMLKEQRVVDLVELELPAGMTASFKLMGQSFKPEEASCYVVKDAGDDPDVTDGVEVNAAVSFTDLDGINIRGGIGVGTVTKPGLPVAVGEPAINPVPRRMIEDAVRSVFPDAGLQVTIAIPDGVERSQRTLNERLGIIGGLSILGTTGIVRPVSNQAWTDTIDVAIDVALATGNRQVVLVTGRTSERVAQAHLSLPEEAFVMMGDHVGYALDACRRKNVSQVVVAAQFAKLLKIACGHQQTHVDSSQLDLGQLAAWSRDAGLDASVAEKIECANTAREVLTALPEAGRLAAIIAEKALPRLKEWAGGLPCEILLIGYNDSIFAEYST